MGNSVIRVVAQGFIVGLSKKRIFEGDIDGEDFDEVSRLLRVRVRTDRIEVLVLSHQDLVEKARGGVKLRCGDGDLSLGARKVSPFKYQTQRKFSLRTCGPGGPISKCGGGGNEPILSQDKRHHTVS